MYNHNVHKCGRLGDIVGAKKNGIRFSFHYLKIYEKKFSPINKHLNAEQLPTIGKINFRLVINNKVIPTCQLITVTRNLY